MRWPWAGIEGMHRQRQGRPSLALEPRADCLGLAGGGAVPIFQAPLFQMLVQFLVVVNMWDRRCPAALQGLDPVLDPWLLVAASGHAESWVEVEVAGQGEVAVVEPSLASGQDGRGD